MIIYQVYNSNILLVNSCYYLSRGINEYGQSDGSKDYVHNRFKCNVVFSWYPCNIKKIVLCKIFNNINWISPLVHCK